MPLSITGGHGGSYRKHNPQLSQTLESLKLICQQLNQSPSHWWSTPAVMKSIEEMWIEKRRNKSHDDDNEDDNSTVDMDQYRDPRIKYDDDDENEDNGDQVMVDLSPKNLEAAGSLARAKNEDDVSIDSDDSLWQRGKNCQSQ
jgi:hypothetical protein